MGNLEQNNCICKGNIISPDCDFCNQKGEWEIKKPTLFNEAINYFGKSIPTSQQLYEINLKIQEMEPETKERFSFPYAHKTKNMENTIPFTIEQWQTGEYDAVLPTDTAPIQLQTTSMVIVESSPDRYITLYEPIYYADIDGVLIQYSRYGVPSDASKSHLTLRLRPKIKTYYVNIHQNANGTYLAQMPVFTDAGRAAKESTKAYAQGSKFIKTISFEL